MKKAIIALAVTVGMGALGIAVAAAKDMGDRPHEGGAVVPCSLAGVNPVHHPEVFGNAATAAAYGFVRSRDGTWQVGPNCRR